APGAVADDGDGANSIFTSAILDTLARPGLELDAAFKRVRARVLAATNNRQVPWTASSVTGDFYFRLPDGGPPPSPPPKHQVAELDREMFVAAVGAANVRAGPGTTHAKVAKLPPGTAVEVTGKVADKDWYRVALADGKQGFVWGPLLSAQGPAAKEKQSPKVAVGVYAKRYQPGDTFRDCPDCPELVVVPPGSFQMGSTAAERDWAVEQGAKAEWVEDEKPRHRVEISYSLAVGKYEVTRGQYAAFVRATDRGDGDGCYWWTGKKWQKDGSRNWRGPGYDQGDDHPVVCVDWRDAAAYADWLSKLTGQTYRLLSEAEWEYVARAGTTTYRYWGDDRDNRTGCDYANVTDATHGGTPRFSCSDGHKFTAPAGKYRANAFGLHDVLGNVWEWVEDCYHDSYQDAPANGEAWTTGGECSRRVLRGGSWGSVPWYLRSAVRLGFRTGDRGYYFGFRLARTLSR
ncbi:MAG: SUMF1/EgtB/PvdO family nonheme iron enzyme, partial [Alphaproteobacteria bacterium]|nr:SUMF1/EgtB/PvdO family nonheme iron enzyme [Alphaproteobacteria bacterium]